MRRIPVEHGINPRKEQSTLGSLFDSDSNATTDVQGGVLGNNLRFSESE